MRRLRLSLTLAWAGISPDIDNRCARRVNVSPSHSCASIPLQDSSRSSARKGPRYDDKSTKVFTFTSVDPAVEVVQEGEGVLRMSC